MTSRRSTLLHVEDRDVYCRNGCQFYGNPEWEGFCSKCYKLVRQQKQPLGVGHGSARQDQKSSSDSGGSGGGQDFFSRFEEKKTRQKEQQQRGSKSLKNFIRRANTLKESTSFSLGGSSSGPTLRDKKACEALAALKEDLRRKFNLRQEVCVEVIKNLNATFEKMETFFKKNESMSSMSDMIQDGYQLIHDRVIQDNPQGQTVAIDVVELCEDLLISSTYDVLFSVLSTEEERRDLGLLQRIRSLHWVRAHHLELDIDDIHPTVKEFMDEAITQLIFVDSKRSPREKLLCVVDAAKNIFKMLQAAPKGPSHAGADDFLPAMIYVVLRANPPRLHTNIKLVTLFSAQSRLRTGESGYMFTNLCGAVNFIENLTAGELQMPPEEFESYITGKAVPTEDALTEGARQMYHNLAALKELHMRQDRLADATQQLKLTLESLQRDIGEQVSRALERSKDATQPHEYRVPTNIPTKCIPAFLRQRVLRVDVSSLPQFDSPPPNLPEPLEPELLHSSDRQDTSEDNCNQAVSEQENHKVCEVNNIEQVSFLESLEKDLSPST